MPDLSNFSLAGKKALVTGGASGIGRACAVGMAKAGADVAIVDLNESMGREAVSEVEQAGTRSLFVRCDVTDPAQVAGMVNQVTAVFGWLDIALNNAGGGMLGGATFGEEAIGVWRRLMELDLNSVFYCCREEGKVMIPRNGGKIINMASMEASIVSNLPVMDVGIVAYCAAKAGVRHLTKALAMEWVGHNIRVNSVSPGVIDTPLIQAARTPEFIEHINRTTPMRRWGKVEEMVGGVVYLASDASSYVTGFDLVMDGGCTVW